MTAPISAATWLDDWLEAYPWSRAARDAGPELIRAAADLPKKMQVSLQREAVARLPLMRTAPDDPHRWDRGSAVYALACRLYAAKLPYTASDIHALLASSKHDCGHGQDVKAPFETAIAWARAHGVTSAWLSAVRTFIDGLTGLTSVKANELKRKGALVLLLDTECRSTSRCWSERFRAGLREPPVAERVAWERLVLFMGTALGSKVSKDFEEQSRALIAFLGAPKVVSRLEEWLPNPAVRSEWALQTAGSHLLKNFVWLLLVTSSDPTAAPLCDPLVERLTRIVVTPVERQKKVAVACAAYFSRRPPAVGREPLERVLAWSVSLEKAPWDSDGIRKIVDAYRAQHAQ